ncbi:TPA: hypothetical protein I9778_001093 [Legionella pneumophila]|nr:hypothetical protein [Legionella pneumophila]
MQDDLKYYFWAGPDLIAVAILLLEVTNERQKSGVGLDCSLQVFSIRGHMMEMVAMGGLEPPTSAL